MYHVRTRSFPSLALLDCSLFHHAEALPCGQHATNLICFSHAICTWSKNSLTCRFTLRIILYWDLHRNKEYQFSFGRQNRLHAGFGQSIGSYGCTIPWSSVINPIPVCITSQSTKRNHNFFEASFYMLNSEMSLGLLFPDHHHKNHCYHLQG